MTAKHYWGIVMLAACLTLRPWGAHAQPVSPESNGPLKKQVHHAVDQLLSQAITPSRSNEPIRVVVLDFPAQSKTTLGISDFSDQLHQTVESVLRADHRVVVVSQKDYVLWQKIEAMDFQVRSRGPQANDPVHAEISGSYSWDGDQVAVKLALADHRTQAHTNAEVNVPLKSALGPQKSAPAKPEAVLAPRLPQAAKESHEVADSLTKHIPGKSGLKIWANTLDGRRAFHDGDRFGLWARVGQPAYVVVLAHDREGETTILYPLLAGVQTPLRAAPAGALIEIPGPGYEIEARKPYGGDLLQVFAFSREADARAVLKAFAGADGLLAALSGARRRGLGVVAAKAFDQKVVGAENSRDWGEFRFWLTTLPKR